MMMIEEPDGVWGDLDKPFEGFKIASVRLKHQKYQPEEEFKEPER